MSHLKLVTPETSEEFKARTRALQKQRSVPGAPADSFKYEGKELPDETGKSILKAASIGIGLTAFFFVVIYLVT